MSWCSVAALRRTPGGGGPGPQHALDLRGRSSLLTVTLSPGRPGWSVPVGCAADLTAGTAYRSTPKIV